MPGTYYADHTGDFRRELAETLDKDAVRALHEKSAWRHFLVVARNLACLVGAEWLLVTHGWRWFTPLAILVAGFAVFNFTVLLHEVVHLAVTAQDGKRPWLIRLLGLAYAMPSGISASQFTRWHLDHHAGLGSPTEDPKRHWLSPKRNSRLLKLAYYTPLLFPIYFRASANENATYEPALQKRIRLERWATILFQLCFPILLWRFAGGETALRAYILPVFGVFPIAFALNRLGQHYAVTPADPAGWSTLVKGNWFWDFAFLYSNYHLEHHYFPGVPFYNLPRLQKLLTPIYEKHGLPWRGYADLWWNWIVRNKPPHTDWRTAA